jgi:hypothetical protein
VSEPVRLEAIASQSVTAEERLWRAALARLLDDAQAYWMGRRSILSSQEPELEQAFDDVMRTGPMLRWCCDHCEYDAGTVAEAFVRMLDRV